MNTCPDIDVLIEDPNARRLHVEGCEACRGVSALLDLRHERIAGADDACEQAEVSIALLHEGLLSETRRANLVEHLERCAACNETATRVFALPAFDAASRVSPPQPGFWRTTTLALGVTTVLASAAALVLFVSRERHVDPVPVAAERIAVQKSDERPAARVVAPVPSVTPPSVPLVQPQIAVPSPPPVPVPVPATSPPKNDDDVMNPFDDATGFLTVMCVPACDMVTVSGKELGPSPVVRTVLPTGKVTVTGRKGRVVRSSSVVIQKGETRSVNLRMTTHFDVDPGF